MSEPTEREDGAGAGEELGGGYPAHQAFKTRAREVYCSSYIVRNHTEGAKWVGECMAHFGIKGSDLLGKPYLEDDCPDGATVWP